MIFDTNCCFEGSDEKIAVSVYVKVVRRIN